MVIIIIIVIFYCLVFGFNWTAILGGGMSLFESLDVSIWFNGDECENTVGLLRLNGDSTMPIILPRWLRESLVTFMDKKPASLSSLPSFKNPTQKKTKWTATFSSKPNSKFTLFSFSLANITELLRLINVFASKKNEKNIRMINLVIVSKIKHSSVD